MMPRALKQSGGWALASRVVLLIAVLCRGLASQQAWAGSEITLGSGGSLPECIHASLHDGSCTGVQDGQLAAVTDATDFAGDRCDVAATGGGSSYLVCRYSGGQWREFGAGAATTSFSVASASASASTSVSTSTPTFSTASAAAEIVLDILNPPAGSGLVAPVGDGIDGEPNAPRTDDAPAIMAAIQYACDNGYDIAYLGPGTYRIGEADTATSFYSGIRIDASTCPSGIKFYGAGVGRTVLLANGDAGQYIITTIDAYNDAVSIHRIGWNTYGSAGDREVIGITTGVTPPVVTGSADSQLEDGDTVYIRNCSGVTQVNDKTFKVNNCTATAPFSCELQNELGVDVDATAWNPWTDETPCIVHKLNTEFETEIAYMTLRDDDIEAHMTVVCNPNCFVPGEESHGIGIIQGGGVVEVHNVMLDRFGDEAIDISAPESPTYIHDVTIVNAVHGGFPIYQGVGIRVEDVWVHKDIASLWHKLVVGNRDFIPYTAGDAFSIDPGTKNWRVVDTQINRVVVTGQLGIGFKIRTNPTGFSGQYVSGVKVTNSIINLIPQNIHCDDGNEICGSFDIGAGTSAFPMDNIEVSGNYMTGGALLFLENGAGGVVLRDNTMVPIPTISPQWGIETGSVETTIEDNDVSGFGRGCIHYRPYPTNGGLNSTITTTIRRNVLACDSDPTSIDPMIGKISGTLLPPAAGDPGYFQISDNQITAEAGDFIRRGIVITESWKNVEICRNTISIESTESSSYGIWSFAADQVICDNVIDVVGSGIRAEADGSSIVGNTITGSGADNQVGILVVDSSDTLVSQNVVSGMGGANASGIKLEAGSASQNKIRIIGNKIGAGPSAISLDGESLGLDEISISANVVDLDGIAGADAILLRDATNVRVTGNELMGLTGSGTHALLTVGSTDFIFVRDNEVEGGGTLKFGTTNGDASCDPVGGVGINSVCSDNQIQ